MESKAGSTISTSKGTNYSCSRIINFCFKKAKKYEMGQAEDNYFHNDDGLLNLMMTSDVFFIFWQFYSIELILFKRRNVRYEKYKNIKY